jgi:hypothetical protein
MKSSAARTDEVVGSGSQPSGVRSKGPKALRTVHATVGDLIASAFDVTGGDLSDVVRLLSSRPMRRALKHPLVFE